MVTADQRAEHLFREVLGDMTWVKYWDQGWFDVKGSDGNTYVITRVGFSHNVFRMDATGQIPVVNYCAHLAWDPHNYTYPPNADHHLAQALLLMTDAPRFARIAPHFTINQYDRPVYRQSIDNARAYI